MLYTLNPSSAGVYDVVITLCGVAAKELFEIVIFRCVNASGETEGG